MNNKTPQLLVFLPVLLSFFAMGFVDLVGIASNYVKADLGLSDATANLMPSLVFFWFFLFSVPTGMLMNRIGRKRTVLLSLVVTLASLVLPLFGEDFGWMLLSFSFLGIGNAIMQTSLNPLISSLVCEANVSSMLTFGQFVKAIASFLAPIIAAWGATGNAFGLGWRILFPIYALAGVTAVLMLSVTPIEEEKPDKASGMADSLRLLRKPFVLLCFASIVCHVGIDVGTNTTAPKILQEHLGLSLEEAGFATSIYFIFRTAGCFVGAFLLRRMREKTFFALSVMLMALGMAGFFTLNSTWGLNACIALVGLGNSNIFPITVAQALRACPDRKNEASGLMIMGLAGGAVFPLLMGKASDALSSQTGAVAVMAVAVAYLFVFTSKIKNSLNNNDN